MQINQGDTWDAANNNILLNYFESWWHLLTISETLLHWQLVNKMNLGRENPKIWIAPQPLKILDLLRHPSFRCYKTESLAHREVMHQSNIWKFSLGLIWSVHRGKKKELLPGKFGSENVIIYIWNQKIYLQGVSYSLSQTPCNYMHNRIFHVSFIF